MKKMPPARPCWALSMWSPCRYPEGEPDIGAVHEGDDVDEHRHRMSRVQRAMPTPLPLLVSETVMDALIAASP